MVETVHLGDLSVLPRPLAPNESPHSEFAALHRLGMTIFRQNLDTL